MNYLAAGPLLQAAAGESDINGLELAAFFGLLAAVIIIVGGATATWLDLRKAKIVAGQEDALRQLVNRYEQLASTTLDAQQRIAADMSELRSRTASIEQILRSVE